MLATETITFVNLAHFMGLRYGTKTNKAAF